MSDSILSDSILNFIVFFLSVVFFIINFFILKFSTFNDLAHDAVKQVKSASNFRNWGGWSSNMHKNNDKARMKDISIILIIPFQIFFKDKISFFPLAMVSNFAHSISAIFLYLIIKKIFGSDIAILIFFIYLFSIWSFMIILDGGFQIVGQMFFLISIFFLINNYSIISLLLSGFFFTLMNFSSASSRKYIIPYLIAILFFLSTKVSLYENIVNFKDNFYFFFNLFFIIFILISLLLINFFDKIIVKNIFLRYIKKILEDNHQYDEFFLFYIKILKKIKYLLFLLFFYLILILLLFNNNSYNSLFLIFIGSFLSFLYFILPNILDNLKGYIYYWMAEELRSHYPIYDKYFLDKYGKIYIQGNEGLLWYFKFFIRIIPGEFFLFTFSFIFLIYFSIAHNLVNIIQIVIIYLISITPILISEFTRGPKYILPLYTTYITLLIPIAFCINFIFNELGFLYNYYILFALITFLICSRNIFILILDIIPSKLIIYNLFKTLKKNNIKDFYTYDNNFNSPFIKIFQFKYGKDFNIKFIKKINELDKGFVFVPCLASTATYYESDPKIGPIGDFNGDKEIIELIKSKKINNLALAKFKNFGTSKYWQLLNHLSSIRDLLLNEVDNNKKSLGYAWLIDLSKK